MELFLVELLDEAKAFPSAIAALDMDAITDRDSAIAEIDRVKASTPWFFGDHTCCPGLPK